MCARVCGGVQSGLCWVQVCLCFLDHDCDVHICTLMYKTEISKVYIPLTRMFTRRRAARHRRTLTRRTHRTTERAWTSRREIESRNRLPQPRDTRPCLLNRHTCEGVLAPIQWRCDCWPTEAPNQDKQPLTAVQRAHKRNGRNTLTR
jgi:hypothetical protein